MVLFCLQNDIFEKYIFYLKLLFNNIKYMYIKMYIKICYQNLAIKLIPQKKRKKISYRF